MLVQRNYLSRAELQAILCSVIMDAALVLMAPADQDAFVSDVRFAAPGTHWAGAFSSLCVNFVLAEASKMAERVSRYNLARTTGYAPPEAPVLSPTAVLPPPASVTRLPHRAPRTRRAARPVMSAPVWINAPEMTEPAPPGDFAAAQPDLLRRVLVQGRYANGLRVDMRVAR